MVLEFCMGTRPLFSSENVKSFTVKMLWLQTFNLFFSHVLVNSLFAEPSVGEGLCLKIMVHLTFHTSCLSLCFANSISLLSDHLKSSIPFFPLSVSLPLFATHTGKSDWFTAQLAVLLLFDVFSLFCTLRLLQKWWYVIVPVLRDVQHYIDWSESENERGYWPYLKASIKIICS